MTNLEFIKMVSLEARTRSKMTYSFSKRQGWKFEKWFIKKARKHMSWNRDKSREEFQKFLKAFTIHIYDAHRSPIREEDIKNQKPNLRWHRISRNKARTSGAAD